MFRRSAGRRRASRNTPSLIRSTRRRGTPSKSNGRAQRARIGAVVPDRDRRRGDLLSCLAAEARPVLEVAAAAESHVGEEPGKRGDGRRLQDDRVGARIERDRPLAARPPCRRRASPIASGSIDSAEPGERLGEPAAVLAAGHHGGERRLRSRRPAELSLGVRDAELGGRRSRTRRPRRSRLGTARSAARRLRRATTGRCRRCLEEPVHVGDVGLRRETREERVGRRDLGHLLGARGRARAPRAR